MKLEITKHGWHTSGLEIISISGMIIGTVTKSSNQSRHEANANAELIADAGTTANKCGLLPSELLSQRDELLKSLIEVIEFNEITFKRLGPDYTKMIDLAKTRINKSLVL